MKADLKNAIDNRLLVFAGVQYVEKTPFMIIVANDGRQIIEELVLPYELGVGYALRKITELVQVYSKYAPDLVELQTDNRELIKLASNTAGIFVRPMRSKDIQPLTNRTLQTYAEDGIIYEIYDIEPLNEPKERSKLRTWLISVLKAALNKLEGER